MKHSILAIAAVLAFARTVAMAQPLIPPDTDFSKFANKYVWQQSPQYLQEESRKVAGENRVESKVPPYTLPDMFKLASGAQVRTIADWDQHRAELLELIRSEIYGYAPPRPD